jgi:hypothetical protein
MAGFTSGPARAVPAVLVLPARCAWLDDQVEVRPALRGVVRCWLRGVQRQRRRMLGGYDSWPDVMPAITAWCAQAGA